MQIMSIDQRLYKFEMKMPLVCLQYSAHVMFQIAELLILLCKIIQLLGGNCPLLAYSPLPFLPPPPSWQQASPVCFIFLLTFAPSNALQVIENFRMVLRWTEFTGYVRAKGSRFLLCKKYLHIHSVVSRVLWGQDSLLKVTSLLSDYNSSLQPWIKTLQVGHGAPSTVSFTHIGFFYYCFGRTCWLVHMHRVMVWHLMYLFLHMMRTAAESWGNVSQ